MEKITVKPHTKAFLFALLIASIYVFAYAVKEISAQTQDETAGGSRHINFIEDKFSYLNMAAVSRRFVERSLQCALMCLESLPCFSFNLAAFPDNNDKLLCEYLPSDKYNNSEKFNPSNAFHHFSIWSPCSVVVCGNNGKCVPLYKENSYVCLCKEGFTGRNCETVVRECKSYITLNEADRNVHYRGKAKCDNNLKTEWYRFQGQAGRQLATICPRSHRCNTDLPGWMNGKHPDVEDGIVQRQVCFHGYNNCCYKTTTINVRNCSAYFVYRLTNVPYCGSRYCGTG